jgi:hypothetical protein
MATNDDLFVSLDETLLKTALGRVAHVLKPYPKDLEQPQIDEALARLAGKGLINLHGREPNLTRAGAEVAQKLLDRDKPKETRKPKA